tara:strand:- start:1872 stop:2489 length:618 start_codon:yes stop_codon:yes gene_type:complete
MRLTSYNVAVKALNAKGCLSDTVNRMWDYMEEGDIDKAQCARDKAIVLDSLICALERWVPVISKGKSITRTITYVSGGFTFPYHLYYLKANTFPMANQITQYSGSNAIVYRAAAASVNNYLNSNSDKVITRINVNSNSGIVIKITFEYTSDMSPIIFTTLSSTNASLVDTQTMGLETNITNEPYCLTNTQLLSVIGKIDKICQHT